MCAGLSDGPSPSSPALRKTVLIGARVQGVWRSGRRPTPAPGLSAQDQGREEGWKVGPHALAPRPLWAPVC